MTQTAWPSPAPVSYHSLSFTASMLKALVAAPVADGIGVACSLLLHYAQQHPHTIRRVLNEPIIRDGFRGTTLLAELTRAAR